MPGPISKSQFPIAQLSGTDFKSEPAANTAAVITIAAPAAGFRIYLQSFEAYYDATPTASLVLTIESPSATFVWRIPAPSTSFSPLSRAYLGGGPNGTDGAAMIITLPAGGAAVGGHLFAVAGTEPTIA